jgi:phosphohistidine phosphatase SixA
MCRSLKYREGCGEFAFAKAKLININQHKIVDKGTINTMQCIFAYFYQDSNHVMKNLLYILFIALISCNNSNSQTDNDGMTTFYFLRHAEKQTNQGSDPELTANGEARAAEWVNYFFLKDVDAILSSDTQRTRNTAAALARAKKLDTEIYDVANIDGKSLLEKYRGKTVVVFGHSNTINTYANDLQNDQKYGELDENDFDHYFIVRVDKNGNSSATKEAMDFEQD